MRNFENDAKIKIRRPVLHRDDILFPELSYEITGICLQVKKELGRFAREKQVCDRLEQNLKKMTYLIDENLS